MRFNCWRWCYFHYIVAVCTVSIHICAVSFHINMIATDLQFPPFHFRTIIFARARAQIQRLEYVQSKKRASDFASFPAFKVEFSDCFFSCFSFFCCCYVVFFSAITEWAIYISQPHIINVWQNNNNNNNILNISSKWAIFCSSKFFSFFLFSMHLTSIPKKNCSNDDAFNRFASWEDFYYSPIFFEQTERKSIYLYTQ